MLTTPLITYNSITVNNKSIDLSGSGRVSFNAPYNAINITFTPTNSSLSYYEVRITAANADYDIGVGQRAYWNTNIPLNESHSFSIAVNSTNFSLGDGTYRVGLYAKSSADGSWDMSYLYFTIGAGAGAYTLSDGSTLAVLTTREPPNV